MGSAAEKLRALEEVTQLANLPSPFNVIGQYGQWASLAEPYRALRYALPQIVAVVEAAELALPGPYVSDEGPAIVSMDRVVPLFAALSALEEALA